MYDYSKLFARPGYIPLREYLADIDAMRLNGPWRLPLRMVDRFQLLILRVLVRISWFSDVIYIVHGSSLSPAYTMLISYAKQQGILDSMGERDLHCQGYYSYFLIKSVSGVARNDPIPSQGIAEDRATALSKALGEMIERVITGVYDKNKDLLLKSPERLMAEGDSFIYPPRYHRFFQIQKERFKRLHHDPSIPITWVKGVSLVKKNEVFIPKIVTQWFIANSKRSDALMHSTTNGSAGYFTKTGAVLRGMLEVVQRDGFLVHWLTMIAPERISIETLPKDLCDRVRKLEAYGLTIHILNVTALSIPSIIIAILNDRSEYPPQVTLSGASDVTFRNAIENALREIMIASEVFYYPEKGRSEELEKNEPEPFLSHYGKTERVLYWRGAERMSKFSWFISGDSVAYDDVCQKYDAPVMSSDKQRLNWCINQLKGFGSDYHPVAYFPKNRIQHDLGFYVAQVFIPKAFPFYLVEYMGTFDSDRLKEFAHARGVTEWKLNPYPHMFS